MTMLCFISTWWNIYFKLLFKKKVDQKNYLLCIVCFRFLTFYYLCNSIPFTNIGQILLKVLIYFL